MKEVREYARQIYGKEYLRLKKKKDSINAMKQEAIWCFTKNSGDRLPVSGSASRDWKSPLQLHKQ